jgi:uncharacterized membrane protein
MLSKRQLRDAHVAIAIGTMILFVGGFLVRDAGEGAMQLVGVLAFFATFGTLVVLAERELRRKRAEGDQ